MANNLYEMFLQTAQITTGTPETVVNDQNAQNPLGAMLKWNGNVYRYVKFNNGVGNVASADNGCAHWYTGGLDPDADAPLFTVTSDNTDALATINSVAGIFKGVVTDLYHSFIAIGGVHDATIREVHTAGDALHGGTTDLQFDVTTDGTAPIAITVGTVLATGAAATDASVLLNGALIW